MGYETRMYVVRQWEFTMNHPTGEELACIDLCKCGNSAVAELIGGCTKRAEGKPPFALFARTPDRQTEAVIALRLSADDAMRELADDIDDGYVTRDMYGNHLGVIDIDDMIAALTADITSDQRKGGQPYRRFVWALALLTTIKTTWPEGGLKVITYGH